MLFAATVDILNALDDTYSVSYTHLDVYKRQTINYAELYQQIIQEVETTSFNLIEALAGHLAEMILKNYHVKQVKVKVEKSEAKFNGMVFPAAVEIKRLSLIHI